MIYGNKLTKEEIIIKAHNESKKGTVGFFLNTDGICSDLDGKGMAEYLKSIGFNVTKHYDTGTNGIVLTEEGIKVSTNGFCSIINK